jgi:XTP/dITP diphosphohydrolase
MRILVATSNQGKLREFQIAAQRSGLSDVAFAPLPDFRSLPTVEETGSTFEENACIKAVHYSGFTEDLLLAEDSGLVVDALGGAPGVYSARFAGPNADDEANNHLLLERLNGVENRVARFVCVIAVARRRELIATFEGTVEGRILHAPQGTHGFGYDPLFFYPPSGCSTAELDPETKLSISHRGKAFASMLAWLLEPENRSVIGKD